jgi:hypothetical protein
MAQYLDYAYDRLVTALKHLTQNIKAPYGNNVYCYLK